MPNPFIARVKIAVEAVVFTFRAMTTTERAEIKAATEANNELIPEQPGEDGSPEDREAYFDAAFAAFEKNAELIEATLFSHVESVTIDGQPAPENWRDDLKEAGWFRPVFGNDPDTGWEIWDSFFRRGPRPRREDQK